MLVYFSGHTRFVGSLRQQFSDENAASWSTKLCLSGKMDALVVNSSFIKNELASTTFPEEKIKVILNIFEQDGTGNIKRENVRKKLISDFSLPQDAVIVAGIGRNSKVKNFDFFVDVLKEAAKTNSKIHGIIIGSGGEGVKERVQKEGLSKLITLPGEIPDAKKYLPGADIFFLSSLKEGLPNVLIEALASGCACLAADVSGVRDIFCKIPHNIRDKMIIKEHDIMTGTARLLELAENKHLREKCSSFSGTVKEIFNPECILKEFEKIL
jgi:glycosyltransferase involved in cell wall biosynthesis